MKTVRKLKPVEGEIRFEVAYPPERVWPILSHTEWLNRAVGLPPVFYQSTKLPAGGVTLDASAKLAPGQPVRWKEFPFEWLQERYFSERRIFFNGPFAEFYAHFSLAPGGAGTQVIVSVSLTPRNAAAAALARALIWKKNWDFEKIRKRVETHLAEPPYCELPYYAKTPTREAPLEDGLQKMREAGWGGPVLQKLEKFLREAPDAEVVKVRAFRVADVWGEDRWNVLKLFLHATRAGLVDLSWEVLCPNCRGDRAPKGTLAELKGRVHCPTCQITFDSHFDQSVELKFSIDPAVRPAPREIFCLGGPGQNSNIVAQRVLGPCEDVLWELPGIQGAYRVRSPQVPDGARIVEIGGAHDGALPEFGISENGWEPAPPKHLAGEKIRVRNRLPQEAIVLLEREDWNRDVATAALVTNWQEFRDLFSKEVLGGGEEIEVGRQILLFTDLRGSTSLYQKIGDAPAYGRVREHFGLIQDVLKRRHGGLVKTIGDAVMATFSGVTEALEATVEMETAMVASGWAALKAGLHLGPCIAVNANERLDYFGSTVNLAARLTSLCREREIIVSDELMNTAEARAFLAKKGLHADAFTAELRGFADPKKVWRIRLAG
ncbi:MAG: adenylate/guanylate cyclase domain-containing protein [Verrucomicrobiae bacterium]|nr:adenylate/guanylate cyclase domain-containing protein [Verrucomicrobiae bacterium]